MNKWHRCGAIVLLGACLMALGCGPKEAKEPGVTSPRLEVELARVEPLLLWGCDLPTEVGRKDCSGDGMSMAGRWLLDGGPDARVWAAVKASIDEDGRPWRAPDRVGKQPSDSFSRDGFIGLLESTVAMNDKGPLGKVWGYVKRTGKLCPDGSDGRCDVTPGVSILAREVLGEFVRSAERVADEATMTAEAIGAPGNYRAYLVARKVHLKARLGRLTRGYCHAVVVLRDHFPKNVFFRTVDAECGRGGWEAIADSVSGCLGAWKNPGLERLAVSFVAKGATTPLRTYHVFSGAPGKQVFQKGGTTNVPRSLMPCPQGKYTVGKEEWFEGRKDDFRASWGPGLGPCWIPFEPTFPTRRGDFGIHLDENHASAPGSAGCLVFETRAHFEEFLAAFRLYKPTGMIVDWGIA